MSTTNEDLQAAFAGESQASRKYICFAAKADSEGQKQVARLFRAAAEAETVHARNHLTVMGGIKTTKDNLEGAIAGERYEFTAMYPQFIEQASKEGNEKARESFELADKVEQIHHTLYGQALEAVTKGEKLEEQPIFVCQYCGNTVLGAAPDRCPICGAPRRMFSQID